MFTYKWVFTKKSLLASQRATIWFWMYFTLSNEVHGKQPLKISYGVKFSLVLELIFLLLQLQTKISSSNTLAFCLHNENNRAIPTQNLNKISYSTAHRDWEFTHTVYECFSLCPYKKKYMVLTTIRPNTLKNASWKLFTCSLKWCLAARKVFEAQKRQPLVSCLGTSIYKNNDFVWEPEGRDNQDK